MSTPQSATLELNAVCGRVHSFENSSKLTTMKCTKTLELNAVFGRVHSFENTSKLTAMKCTKIQKTDLKALGRFLFLLKFTI